MSFNVEWRPKARKELMALDPKQRLYIIGWVDENLQGCDNPKAVGGCKKLEGRDAAWRYRVGSYRIIANVYEGRLVIEIVRVGHRQGVYGNLPKS